MSKLIAIMSMSLDGFVADRHGNVADVMRWYMDSGDSEVHTGGSDPMVLRMSAASAAHFRALTTGLGAVLTGRRTFEIAEGWGGNHAWGPAFVLTHEIPSGWPRPDSTVHFITDGLARLRSRQGRCRFKVRGRARRRHDSAAVERGAAR